MKRSLFLSIAKSLCKRRLYGHTEFIFEAVTLHVTAAADRTNMTSVPIRRETPEVTPTEKRPCEDVVNVQPS